MSAETPQSTQPSELDSKAELGSKAALSLCATTTDIDTIVALTRHSHADVRRRALKEICPCRVKSDVEDFWARVLDMLHDPDPLVRYQVGGGQGQTILFKRGWVRIVVM